MEHTIEYLQEELRMLNEDIAKKEEQLVRMETAGIPDKDKYVRVAQLQMRYRHDRIEVKKQIAALATA